MSAKPAALPLFADAYMADTAHLTLEEDGAYLRLMMIAWRSDQCRLPDDDKRLARMLGVGPSKWAKLKPVIMAFWTLKSGYWTQRRLSKERKFVEEKVATNTAAAKARWNKQGLENKQGDECERISERNAPPPPPPPSHPQSVVEEAKASPTKRTSAKGFSPPDWVPSEPWTGFVEMRRKKGGFTERAAGLVIIELNKLRAKGHDPGAVLDQSTLNAWKDVFELRDKSDGQRNGNQNIRAGSKPSVSEQPSKFARAAIDWYELGEQAGDSEAAQDIY